MVKKMNAFPIILHKNLMAFNLIHIDDDIMFKVSSFSARVDAQSHSCSSEDMKQSHSFTLKLVSN